MSALEILEAKSGRIHTVADWRIAGETALADPAALTDLDLAILDHFDGATRAAAWREARETALAPALQTKAIPTPAATPAATVAHLPQVGDDDDFSTDAGLDAWADKNAMAALPVALWRGFVRAAREKRLALEARVAALEGKPT